MNFGITLEIDAEASKKSNIINDISHDLHIFFQNKKYGASILEYYIGCICIKTKPGYEEWYKIRRPRYKEIEILKNINIDGTDLIIKNSYGYDIKLDGDEYDLFVDSTEEESKKILAKKILESLENLDKLPKKIKDFDKEKLKEDIYSFFKMKELI